MLGFLHAKLVLDDEFSDGRSTSPCLFTLNFMQIDNAPLHPLCCSFDRSWSFCVQCSPSLPVPPVGRRRISGPSAPDVDENRRTDASKARAPRGVRLPVSASRLADNIVFCSSRHPKLTCQCSYCTYSMYNSTYRTEPSMTLDTDPGPCRACHHPRPPAGSRASAMTSLEAVDDAATRGCVTCGLLSRLCRQAVASDPRRCGVTDGGRGFPTERLRIDFNMTSAGRSLELHLFGPEITLSASVPTSKGFGPFIQEQDANALS
jgi:hypothetical protein